MVYKAFDNDPVSGETLKVFKVVEKLLRGNGNACDRVITAKEFHSLLGNAKRHLKGILATAYCTGMRAGEIFNLTWDKVDLKNRLIRLEADDIKDREPRFIPICENLFQFLREIPRNPHDDHVFLYKGKPVPASEGP